MTFPNDDLPYYSKIGWYSPEQLTSVARDIQSIDSGLATVIVHLAVIRGVGSSQLEIKFQEAIQRFLRDNVPGFDDMTKRNVAHLN